jgi:hypothetical protein
MDQKEEIKDGIKIAELISSIMAIPHKYHRIVKENEDLVLMVKEHIVNPCQAEVNKLNAFPTKDGILINQLAEAIVIAHQLVNFRNIVMHNQYPEVLIHRYELFACALMQIIRITVLLCFEGSKLVSMINKVKDYRKKYIKKCKECYMKNAASKIAFA